MSIPATTALLPRRTALSICTSCRRNLLRQFTTTRARPLAFQSYPLVPPTTSTTAQPRNTAVPETSITQPVESPPLPRVHETRPPAGADKPAPQLHKGGSKSSGISIPEQLAQQSRQEFVPEELEQHSSATTPAAAAAATAPAQEAKPQRKSRLRTPRKAAMKLTPTAVERLRDLLDQPEPKLIRVGVRNRGCSGLAYHLEYVDEPGRFDEAIEQDGVRVLIDSKALFSIIGSEMDWVEDKLQEKFVFRNPNIKEECGCGESFMV